MTERYKYGVLLILIFLFLKVKKKGVMAEWLMRGTVNTFFNKDQRFKSSWHL